jgi:hypothetical protein
MCRRRGVKRGREERKRERGSGKKDGDLLRWKSETILSSVRAHVE